MACDTKDQAPPPVRGRRGRTALLIAGALTLATACAGPRGAAEPGGAARFEIPGASGRHSLRRAPGGESVRIEEAAAELAGADVVFLGELHDSTEGHAVQLELTKAIAEIAGEVILSMEQLERDAQPRVDLYVSGAISRERFEGGTRLWGNWREHYAPALEFARARGFEVVAANVYRPIASRVAREGLNAGLGHPWAATRVHVGDGEYRERYESLRPHAEELDAETLDAYFAAQCIKDDTMAESIVRAIEARPAGEAPPVVHWNGRFHSDFGLGTAERVKLRRPDLNVAVVTMAEARDLGRDLDADEERAGHFVILVPVAD